MYLDRNRSHNQSRNHRHGWTNRQNDPAYHREVQYTYRDLTEIKFSDVDVQNTVRLLCRDQSLNPPYMNYSNNKPMMTMKSFNEVVDSLMQYTTPINRAI